MDKKRLTELTISDLLNEPIWEHWAESDIEYVKPSMIKEISDDSDIGHIVLTNYFLSNGNKFIGFCSPQDSSGLDYIQPVILTENGQVRLWNDKEWDSVEKGSELQKLGLNWEKVFPIVYKTLIKCNGEYYQGKVTDFNMKK